MSYTNMYMVVTGAGGRLGKAISAELASGGHQVTALGHADLDITNALQVKTVMERLRPHAIVNCSAFNAVDAAETDATAAFAANAHGPSLLAAAAEATGALLVHYSSDFVFDGRSGVPYSEEEPTDPLSVYGASKLAGETGARSACRRHYVLRLESIFGGSGVRGHRATIDQIADNIQAGVVVRALVDRTVSPSYVPDVARATRALIERGTPHGTYHCVNSGFTTWYELANEVARLIGVPARIDPVISADSQAAATRPQFCALSNRKLLAMGIEMPTWQSAVGRHLAARGAQMPAGAAAE